MLELAGVARRKVEVLALDVAVERGVGGAEADLFGTDGVVPENVLAKERVSPSSNGESERERTRCGPEP